MVDALMTMRLQPISSTVDWLGGYRADQVRRVQLRSSTIASAGYDPESGCLEVVFNKGPTYRYFAVPERVFEQLLLAESHGRYLNQHIKGRYPYSVVT
jgi:lysyl-tRNA synthetase class 2